MLGGRSWACAAGMQDSGSPGEGQPGLACGVDLAVLRPRASALRLTWSRGQRASCGGWGTVATRAGVGPAPAPPWPPGSGDVSLASCWGSPGGAQLRGDVSWGQPGREAPAVCSHVPSPARLTSQRPSVHLAWELCLWLAHQGGCPGPCPRTRQASAGPVTQAHVGRAGSLGIQKGQCHAWARTVGCRTRGPGTAALGQPGGPSGMLV